ncbi:MAG: GntR family transcriptional regulator [Roseibium sp.]|uniref:GntR family transcriptional regulator n=1 Tax=Roseibium sp. TaxID=1936156 RepID=UPI00262FE382|nr:GntR family transcriptional regulator [Roseibium sp.]MCV0424155.1 GntR family transcriptional regulator [Roseibium sp.]
MLAENAIAEFKGCLLTQGVKPGSFLTLKEISSLLEIPLGKTREVTQRLALEGFVQIHPQRGIQVTSITVQTIHDAFRFRSIMEEAAVAQFAVKGHIDKINNLIEKTEALKSLDTEAPDFHDKVASVDWEMHFSFIENESNVFLSNAYKLNATYIRWIRANTKIPPTRDLDVIEEHLAILNGCLARNPEAAVTAIRLHLKKASKQALEG